MSDPILVNGHLVLNGVTGNLGDKTGVASIQVSVVFPDLAAAQATPAEAVSAAMNLGRLICVDRPFSELEDGSIRVDFHFSGFASEVDFDQAESQLQLSFQLDMQDAPIQTHPLFLGEKGIAKKYKWIKEEEKFDYTMNGASASATGLPGAVKEFERPDNIFFGVDSWLKVGGVFTRSFAVTHIPPETYRNIGRLFISPPDIGKLGIPKFKKRLWLKLAPNVTQSGSALRVEDKYRLTGVTNGAESIIYGKGQLDD